jgi:DNA-binding transcriptional LysR family regulator
MELRHLRYFVAVAEELHFRRAAERLHMSQPPLSRQIRDLEKDVGTQLFLRDHTHVRLTEMGALFLVEARDILARTERARLMPTSAVAKPGDRLAVGCSTSFDPSTIRGFRAACKRRFPRTSLLLHSYFTPEVVGEMLAGRCDVGFLALPIEAEGLSMVVIRREFVSIAVSKCHPLARRRRVAIGELSGHPLILFNRRRNPAFYDHYLAVFRNGGWNVGGIQEADDRGSALNLVAQGDGFAIASRSMTRIERRDVAYLALHPGVVLEIAIAHRCGETRRRVLDFVEMVRELTRRTTPARPDGISPTSAHNDGGAA